MRGGQTERNKGGERKKDVTVSSGSLLFLHPFLTDQRISLTARESKRFMGKSFNVVHLSNEKKEMKRVLFFSGCRDQLVMAESVMREL